MALAGPSRKHASTAVQEWYDWVDINLSPVILDGGLGDILLERGNDLFSGTLWSGSLISTNKKEVS